MGEGSFDKNKQIIISCFLHISCYFFRKINLGGGGGVFCVEIKKNLISCFLRVNKAK